MKGYKRAIGIAVAAISVVCGLGGVDNEQAAAQATVADSHVIPPHRTWKPQSIASPVVEAPGLSDPLRLYSGGVRLTRACPAGYYSGTSSCRSYPRPGSCPVICPIVAVTPGWGPPRVENISRGSVRVTFKQRRYSR